MRISMHTTALAFVLLKVINKIRINNQLPSSTTSKAYTFFQPEIIMLVISRITLKMNYYEIPPKPDFRFHPDPRCDINWL